jgi:hypothetical protein
VGSGLTLFFDMSSQASVLYIVLRICTERLRQSVQFILFLLLALSAICQVITIIMYVIPHSSSPVTTIEATPHPTRSRAPGEQDGALANLSLQETLGLSHLNMHVELCTGPV